MNLEDPWRTDAHGHCKQRDNYFLSEYYCRGDVVLRDVKTSKRLFLTADAHYTHPPQSELANLMIKYACNEPIRERTERLQITCNKQR
jgi:hypothetical protein